VAFILTKEKQMAKAKAVASSTTLSKWDQRLRDLAAQAMKAESGVGGGGNFVSIRGGILTYQGAQVSENKMHVIIVDAVLENQWYDIAFDPNNPQAPACYAFGREAETMVPHENSSNKQNDDCATCQQMQFGSADRGRGKACKACQRLALITQGDLDNIEDAQVAYLKLPFFSTLEYAAYVRQLNDIYHYPPIAFITEISVVPDAKSQFRVKFKLVSQIDSAEAMAGLMPIRDKTEREIMFPYPKLGEDNGAAPKTNGRGRQAAPAPRQAAPPKRAIPLPAAAPVASAVAQASGAPKVGLKRAVKPAKY
jgi:hypothetical protein